MSIADRREYLRQPAGRSPIDEALRAMPIGGVRSGILGAAGRSGFSPADIASLAHWYDATEISGSDGDSIGTWTDQEGSDNLTQATSSKKPTLRTSGINSKNILEFDNSDDILQGAFSASLSQPNHLFVVFKLRSNSSSTTDYIIDGDDTNNRHILAENNTSTPNLFYFAGSIVNGSNTDTNSHISSMLFNGASSNFRLDGSADASADAGSDSLDGLSVGARFSDEGYSPADVGEILVYDGSLSTSDRNDVESYLSDKWGVTI